MLTSNFDAEYGNSSGGQVLVTTKAGTERCARERVRVSAQHGPGRAELLFQASAQLTGRTSLAARLGERRFARTVAVFADYQGTRLTEGIDTGDIAVPSVAERSGDFSQNPLTGERERHCLGGAAFEQAGLHGDCGRAVLRGVSRPARFR